MITIYHNPRCRKSREALEILKDRNKNLDIILYLQEPLNENQLKQIVSMLEIEPEQLVRKNEVEWKDNFKGKDISQKDILKAITKYPKLMERPVVVNGKKAVIARPPERVLEII
jgi:arsenate reductase